MSVFEIYAKFLPMSLVSLMLFMVFGGTTCDSLPTTVEDCGFYNADKEACNKAQNRKGENCIYDDLHKSCGIKLYYENLD